MEPESCRRAAPAEDAVRYRLFALPGAGGRERLRRCNDGIAERLAPLLAAYIWQRQPFRLRYVPPCGERAAGPRWDGMGEPSGLFQPVCGCVPAGDTPEHIGGTTLFGDNVEDEWFIVYLVREISRAFPELVARWGPALPREPLQQRPALRPVPTRPLVEQDR